MRTSIFPKTAQLKARFSFLQAVTEKYSYVAVLTQKGLTTNDLIQGKIEFGPNIANFVK